MMKFSENGVRSSIGEGQVSMAGRAAASKGPPYSEQEFSLCGFSRTEGGANVLSEAIAASVPILASRIDGNVGILGANYPGYFDVGDTAQLTRLLRRAETYPRYLAKLKAWSKRLVPTVDPMRERQAWSELIEELG